MSEKSSAGHIRPHIYISYKRAANPDESVAVRLSEALAPENHVFLDQHMLIGTSWVKKIEEEILNSDFFIVLLSEESVDSEMVVAEIERARRCFNEHGRPKLLPIRLAYRADLNYRLSSYLNDISWALWESEQDNARIIDELKQVISGRELKMSAPPLATSAADEGPAVNRLPTPLPSARPVPLEQPSGTMDPHSAFYVERDADGIALNEIGKQGVTITIKGPRQVGKSSLLEKTVQSALDHKKQVVFLDFQQFEGSALKQAREFYPQFCHWVWRESGTPHKPRDPDQELGQVQRTTYFMQELVQSLGRPLVLAMDEVERLFASDFGSDFFGMLRSWHNARRPKSPWERLDILLVTSTEPYLFIENNNQSPFNVGEVIELGDFDRADVADLNSRHASPLTLPEVNQLVELIGAHPYLTRKALFLVASGRTSARELFATAADDYGPFGDHLRTLLFHLHDKRVPDKRDLIEGMQQVIQYEQCTDDRVFHRLRGAGLVRRTGSGVAPRCKLYAEFLKRRFHGQ